LALEKEFFVWTIDIIVLDLDVPVL